VLEVLEWMEEAVTDQVAAERDLAACRLAVAELTAELEAIRNTRAWRLLAPPRRLYGKIRRRAGGAR